MSEERFSDSACLAGGPLASSGSEVGSLGHKHKMCSKNSDIFPSVDNFTITWRHFLSLDEHTYCLLFLLHVVLGL